LHGDPRFRQHDADARVFQRARSSVAHDDAIAAPLGVAPIVARAGRACAAEMAWRARLSFDPTNASRPPTIISGVYVPPPSARAYACCRAVAPVLENGSGQPSSFQ
jgi:hypothetical protein